MLVLTLYMSGSAVFEKLPATTRMLRKLRGFYQGTPHCLGSSLLHTSSDTIGCAVVTQPGNRDWVTAIECVNASGWSLLPFLILFRKLHQARWYHGLERDWMLAVSDNDWTTDELGIERTKHFNKHTESCMWGRIDSSSWTVTVAMPHLSLTSTVQRTILLRSACQLIRLISFSFWM
jgi:hypothetical protein